MGTRKTTLPSWLHRDEGRMRFTTIRHGAVGDGVRQCRGRLSSPARVALCGSVLGLAVIGATDVGLTPAKAWRPVVVSDPTSGLSVSAEVRPRIFDFRNGKPHVSYRLHLTTGAMPVRVRVAVRPPPAREPGGWEPLGDALE